MTEMGIATAAMSVLRKLPRKTKTTSAASSEPRIRCSVTASVLVLMSTDSSRRIVTVIPFGSVAFTSSSVSRIFSAIATVLVPDCFRMTTSWMGSLLNEATPSGSAVASTTRATSRSRTIRLFTSRMEMLPSSSASTARPMTRTVASEAPISARPPGMVRFCVAMALATSGAEMLKSSSRSGSTMTWNSRSRAPSSRASPTPLTASSRRTTSRSVRSASSAGSKPSPFTPT